MTHPSRRLRLLIPALLVVALAAAACGNGAASATPSSAPSATAAATASPAVVVTPAPTALPSPTPTATASPSAATACMTLPQTVPMPSDRFTNLSAAAGATSDRLTFVFGHSSLPGPGGPPEGSLDTARPPYTQAGSGATIVVTGDHVLQLRFTGMSLQNDAGEETYTGPREVKPNLPALRHAVLFDASEGVIGWYIGYDGTGCVTFGDTENNVTITFDHS